MENTIDRDRFTAIIKGLELLIESKPNSPYFTIWQNTLKEYQTLLTDLLNGE